MALLEGLSFGVPTIFSNIPENIAVAEDLGYSFEVSNVASLTKKLSFVLNNYAEAEECALKAKQIIRTENTGPYKAIARIIEQGQRNGTLKKFHPEQMAVVFWTSIKGLAIHKAVHGENYLSPDPEIILKPMDFIVCMGEHQQLHLVLKPQILS